MNIVCIEPDVVLAKAYKKVFTKDSKDSVVLCLDPQAAIEQIDTKKPDVIVMELQLAPLSGFAFLHELRSYEDFNDIPVIIYSSVPKESFSSNKTTWKTLGVDKYFYKATDSVQKVATYVHGMVNNA
jgi:DNA-binding response OmpR family regulator